MENGKKYLEQTIAHLARFIADHPHSPEIVSAAKAMAELHNALVAETLCEATRQLTNAVRNETIPNAEAGSTAAALLGQLGEMTAKGGE